MIPQFFLDFFIEAKRRTFEGDLHQHGKMSGIARSVGTWSSCMLTSNGRSTRGVGHLRPVNNNCGFGRVIQAFACELSNGVLVEASHCGAAGKSRVILKFSNYILYIYHCHDYLMIFGPKNIVSIVFGVCLLTKKTFRIC